MAASESDFRYSPCAPPKGRVTSIIFKAFCLASFGRSTLEHPWNVIHQKDDQAWKEEKDTLLNRITNMNVVAGLLMTTTSVILSTTPPAPHFYDWTRPVAYLCILGAFPPTLSALIVGTFLALAVTAAQRDYVRDICASRLHIICLLAVIAYPFVILCYSITLFAVGLVAAGEVTGYKLVMAGSLAALILPLLLIPIFTFVVTASPRR